MRHLNLHEVICNNQSIIYLDECYTCWWDFEFKMCIEVYSRWITPMTDEDSN